MLTHLSTFGPLTWCVMPSLPLTLFLHPHFCCSQPSFSSYGITVKWAKNKAFLMEPLSPEKCLSKDRLESGTRKHYPQLLSTLMPKELYDVWCKSKLIFTWYTSMNLSYEKCCIGCSLNSSNWKRNQLSHAKSFTIACIKSTVRAMDHITHQIKQGSRNLCWHEPLNKSINREVGAAIPQSKILIPVEEKENRKFPVGTHDSHTHLVQRTVAAWRLVYEDRVFTCCQSIHFTGTNINKAY